MPPRDPRVKRECLLKLRFDKRSNKREWNRAKMLFIAPLMVILAMRGVFFAFLPRSERTLCFQN